MADLERVYNVPLRKEFMKVPIYKKTRKAVKALKEFLIKHMKCENVKIGKYANLKLHERGRKNPPHHIQVKAVKTTEKKKGKDIEVVRAELVGAPKEKKEVKEKIEEKKEGQEEPKKEEEVKKAVLEKEDEKVQEKIAEKEKPTKVKDVDKEKSLKPKRELIISKTQKPTHEKKK